MNTKYIQIAGIALTVLYGTFVVWIYWAAPKDLEDVTVKARESVTAAVSKSQVITNTYEIDQTKFQEGIAAFRSDNFVLARDRFSKADPEARDPATQYYIAYSFYREGFGRFSNDDELFQKGIEQIEVVKRLGGDFRSGDPDLKLARPAELENELKEGLRVTVADFNPLKVVRERK